MGTQWRTWARRDTFESELLHSWKGHSHPPSVSGEIYPNFTEHCISMLHKLFFNTEKEWWKKSVNSFCKANTVLILSSDTELIFFKKIKKRKKKKKQDLISLRSTVPETEVQQLIKRVKHHDHEGSPAMQGRVSTRAFINTIQQVNRFNNRNHTIILVCAKNVSQ